MKRFYKLLGIAALVAVIAIGLAGCPMDDDDGIPRFPGAFIYAGDESQWNKDGSEGSYISFRRGGSESSDSFSNNINGVAAGSLDAIDGDTYTVKNSANGTGVTFTATVDGDTLTISSDNENLAGTYTKAE